MEKINLRFIKRKKNTNSEKNRNQDQLPAQKAKE